MKPSEKNPAIDQLLTSLFGVDRQRSISDNVCVDPPIGCGQPIQFFGLWSEIEQGEYKISGLCQKCQKQVFRGNYEDEE